MSYRTARARLRVSLPHRSALVGAVLLAALGTALLPAGGAAQLRIVPKAGLYVPVSDLPSPSEARGLGERESTLALGLDLEIGDASGLLGFRVGALHGTDSDIPAPGFECQDDCARSTVTTVTAALLLRPLPTLVVVRPYAVLGAGLKRYDFDRAQLEGGGFDAFLNDQNVLTGQVGLGAELGLGIARLQVELSDLFSGFDEPDDSTGGEADLQHDLFLTIGVVFGG